MAHLWQTHPELGWRPQQLDADTHTLSHGCMLRKSGIKGSFIAGESWYLLCQNGAAVRVNGQQLILGATLLRDRDEIVIDGLRSFFSTERTAKVQPRPSLENSAHCARCKQPVHEGQLAVTCPACGAWHHQIPDEQLKCWDYAARCSLCDQPTALDAGYRWSPEDLWS